MLRVCLLLLVILHSPWIAYGQSPATVRISVTLLDADQREIPVPRHALLISDNPPSTSPRRVVTGADGAVEVRLAPGNYTVESDRPVALSGTAYQWLQTIDVTAGRALSLRLTTANAERAASSDATSLSTTDTDPKLLAMRFKDSVVAVWTPTARTSAFLATDTGLIVTNQRAVGDALTVEVQVSPTLKVRGRVLASDKTRDVAVVHANPKALASARALPMACGAGVTPTLKEDTDIVALALPVGGTVSVVPGSLTRVEPRTIVTDLILDDGGTGGPAFATDGRFAGLTSTIESDDQRTRGHVSMATAESACITLAAAEARRAVEDPPESTPLPVEPPQAFPVSALEEAVRIRGASLNAYAMSTSDFDLAFMTPIHIYAAQKLQERSGGNGGRPGTPGGKTLVNPVTDFANWSRYVAAHPPVLLVRATPRLVEGFWKTVARGAAMTQGVNLPPMKHVKAGFARMTITCGTNEVLPIHPFVLEQHISETDVVDEGLYAFDPAAIGPHCGTVTIGLLSQKDGARPESRTVDPKVVEQFWRDFEPYRSAAEQTPR